MLLFRSLVDTFNGYMNENGESVSLLTYNMADDDDNNNNNNNNNNIG